MDIKTCRAILCQTASKNSDILLDSVEFALRTVLRNIIRYSNDENNDKTNVNWKDSDVKSDLDDWIGLFLDLDVKNVALRSNFDLCSLYMPLICIAPSLCRKQEFSLFLERNISEIIIILFYHIAIEIIGKKIISEFFLGSKDWALLLNLQTIEKINQHPLFYKYLIIIYVKELCIILKYISAQKTFSLISEERGSIRRVITILLLQLSQAKEVGIYLLFFLILSQYIFISLLLPRYRLKPTG
jgi:hypothetical protein